MRLQLVLHILSVTVERSQKEKENQNGREQKRKKPYDTTEKAVEIAQRYRDLKLEEKIRIIAQTFGCADGVIETHPCISQWLGTSDMFIRFDNGTSLFLGNNLTPKTKTVKLQTEYVDRALVKYNPEIVEITKKTALPTLLQRESRDNEIARQKGLKPYILINVEFVDGCEKRIAGHMGR